MRILVANDDGIDAPGLRLLARAAAALSADVWIVAPERKWTAASHQLSFDRELTLARRAEREYACSGAPADCVVAALNLLFAEAPRPDLVLAGINDKRNVGEDAVYGGTNAIGREASFGGVPAIALSSDAPAARRDGDLAHLQRLLRLLWDSREQWTGGGCWLGIDLPARLPAPLVEAGIGRDKIGSAVDVVAHSGDRVRFRLRRGRPGTAGDGDENALLAAGDITVVRYRALAQDRLPQSLLAQWRFGLA